MRNPFKRTPKMKAPKYRSKLDEVSAHALIAAIVYRDIGDMHKSAREATKLATLLLDLSLTTLAEKTDKDDES